MYYMAKLLKCFERITVLISPRYRFTLFIFRSMFLWYFSPVDENPDSVCYTFSYRLADPTKEVSEMLVMIFNQSVCLLQAILKSIETGFF